MSTVQSHLRLCRERARSTLFRIHCSQGLAELSAADEKKKEFFFQAVLLADRYASFVSPAGETVHKQRTLQSECSDPQSFPRSNIHPKSGASPCAWPMTCRYVGARTPPSGDTHCADHAANTWPCIRHHHRSKHMFFGIKLASMRILAHGVLRFTSP